MTWKMLLLRWDLTTTFVRAKPAFLPLVIVLVVVLVEWNVGSLFSLNKDNHPFLTLKINITSCSDHGQAENQTSLIPMYCSLWTTTSRSCIIRVGLSKPHTSVVYRNMWFDWPTDRPNDQPNSRPTDQLTVSIPLTLYCYIICTCPRMPCSCAQLWTVQCIATRPRTPMMDRRKTEKTPTHWNVRLEQERDQRTSSYLHFLVSVAILSHIHQFFSLVTSHKCFST